MLIRPLSTLEECRVVASLERLVWGYADSEDVVPPPVLIVSIKRGGILLGAFDDDGEMKGFVYSMPAVKDGRLTQWSHMLGVVPGARGDGLGLRLKLAQREHALRMGIELIEWTYDPLQTLNAHFNFARLGIVVENYEENIYGESASPLHRGTPTDRFVAEWRLTAPHVERRIATSTAPLMRDSSVMSAVLVNPSVDGNEWLEPGALALEHDGARRLLVEIPARFTEMQERRPDLALAWRLATRRVFQTYLACGFRVVDFFLASDRGRGHYLLAQK
jgi:predicted GNAT superfamily acetyltransferase